MWVYSCFEGDEDMALAWVQHDLYFASSSRPSVSIGGGSTLGWIWANVQHEARRRHGSIPWIARNLDRLLKIDRFPHKLLQIPHEHIAAYFRWISPRVTRPGVDYECDDTYPLDLLQAWRGFLTAEIPDLLSSDRALVALGKSMVYQLFEAGDDAYHDLQDILMLRYGSACVQTTWWAPEVISRTQGKAGQTTTNTRGAYA